MFSFFSPSSKSKPGPTVPPPWPDEDVGDALLREQFFAGVLKDAYKEEYATFTSAKAIPDVAHLALDVLGKLTEKTYSVECLRGRSKGFCEKLLHFAYSAEYMSRSTKSDRTSIDEYLSSVESHLKGVLEDTEEKVADRLLSYLKDASKNVPERLERFDADIKATRLHDGGDQVDRFKLQLLPDVYAADFYAHITNVVESIGNPRRALDLLRAVCMSGDAQTYFGSHLAVGSGANGINRRFVWTELGTLGTFALILIRDVEKALNPVPVSKQYAKRSTYMTKNQHPTPATHVLTTKPVYVGASAGSTASGPQPAYHRASAGSTESRPLPPTPSTFARTTHAVTLGSTPVDREPLSSPPSTSNRVAPAEPKPAYRAASAGSTAGALKAPTLEYSMTYKLNVHHWVMLRFSGLDDSLPVKQVLIDNQSVVIEKQKSDKGRVTLQFIGVPGAEDVKIVFKHDFVLELKIPLSLDRGLKAKEIEEVNTDRHAFQLTLERGQLPEKAGVVAVTGDDQIIEGIIVLKKEGGWTVIIPVRDVGESKTLKLCASVTLGPGIRQLVYLGTLVRKNAGPLGITEMMRNVANNSGTAFIPTFSWDKKLDIPDKWKERSPVKYLPVPVSAISNSTPNSLKREPNVGTSTLVQQVPAPSSSSSATQSTRSDSELYTMVDLSGPSKRVVIPSQSKEKVVSKQESAPDAGKLDLEAFAPHVTPSTGTVKRELDPSSLATAPNQFYPMLPANPQIGSTAGVLEDQKIEESTTYKLNAHHWAVLKGPGSHNSLYVKRVLINNNVVEITDQYSEKGYTTCQFDGIPGEVDVKIVCEHGFFLDLKIPLSPDTGLKAKEIKEVRPKAKEMKKVRPKAKETKGVRPEAKEIKEVQSHTFQLTFDRGQLSKEAGVMAVRDDRKLIKGTVTLKDGVCEVSIPVDSVGNSQKLMLCASVPLGNNIYRLVYLGTLVRGNTESKDRANTKSYPERVVEYIYNKVAGQFTPTFNWEKELDIPDEWKEKTMSMKKEILPEPSVLTPMKGTPASSTGIYPVLPSNPTSASSPSQVDSKAPAPPATSSSDRSSDSKAAPPLKNSNNGKLVSKESVPPVTPSTGTVNGVPAPSSSATASTSLYPMLPYGDRYSASSSSRTNDTKAAPRDGGGAGIPSVPFVSPVSQRATAPSVTPVVSPLPANSQAASTPIDALPAAQTRQDLPSPASAAGKSLKEKEDKHPVEATSEPETPPVPPPKDAVALAAERVKDLLRYDLFQFSEHNTDPAGWKFREDPFDSTETLYFQAKPPPSGSVTYTLNDKKPKKNDVAISGIQRESTVEFRLNNVTEYSRFINFYVGQNRVARFELTGLQPVESMSDDTALKTLLKTCKLWSENKDEYAIFGAGSSKVPSWTFGNVVVNLKQTMIQKVSVTKEAERTGYGRIAKPKSIVVAKALASVFFDDKAPPTTKTFLARNEVSDKLANVALARDQTTRAQFNELLSVFARELRILIRIAADPVNGELVRAVRQLKRTQNCLVLVGKAYEALVAYGEALTRAKIVTASVKGGGRAQKQKWSGKGRMLIL
jgi:hypothetical protein